ncbi:MAG: cytochrome c biogenesis CcdA family protein [Ethanoligenens sp.]
MAYLLTFLEGIVTFVSPCILPMLPVYLLYFAGDAAEGRRGTALRALVFVLGFTTVFLLMGFAAGAFGHFLRGQALWVRLVGGALLVLFGLDYMGVFAKLRRRGGGVRMRGKSLRFGTAYLFGLVFAVSWTPCVGVFLGSALVLAASAGGAAKGMLLLLLYSAGLGIPFVLGAVLMDRLRVALDGIRRHLCTIQLVCGAALAAVGVLMMLGMFDKLPELFSGL